MDGWAAVEIRSEAACPSGQPPFGVALSTGGDARGRHVRSVRNATLTRNAQVPEYQAA